MSGTLRYLLRGTYLHLCPLLRTIRINFLRRSTQRRGRRLFFTTSYSVTDMATDAKLTLFSNTFFGFKKYRGSRLETSLWMDKGSKVQFGLEGSGDKGSITIFHGCDIQVFHDASFTIGSGCVMNRGAQIICQESISIGEGCLISRDVVIRDNDGGHRMLVEGYKTTAPVTIGNHVWIGQGAMILKGSVIGDGAVIGAGAIVSGKVKPKALVMADPSRTFAKDIEWER